MGKPLSLNLHSLSPSIPWCLPLLLFSRCHPSYYSDRGNCAKCYLSCHTCSGPGRDQCVKCTKGWLFAGGECHPECPEGFFRTNFGCQKCHHYCKTCGGAGPAACTSCPAHFMLGEGLCVECLGSQYYDPPTQSCKTCHESCRSCSGPGQYSCLTCAYPLHLDRLNNQCVPCCPANSLPEAQNCCNCDKESGKQNTAHTDMDDPLIGYLCMCRCAVACFMLVRIIMVVKIQFNIC